MSPFTGLIAMSGRKSSARIGKPSSGTTSWSKPSGAILTGADQCSPTSLERMTLMYTVCSVATAPVNRLAATLYSVPSGATAIWLPCRNVLDERISTGVDHVWPPSVVRENIGVPRKANEWKSAVGEFRPSAGWLKRSHVAYAYPARVGSPVIDTLSLKADRSPTSSWMTCGARHAWVVRSKEVTEIAERPRSAESIGWPMK